MLDPQSLNIFITSPTATTTSSRFPPPLSTNLSSASLHSVHSLGSPNSSPSQAEFPPHPMNSLSRQHSFQHYHGRGGENAASTPLPPSPGSSTMDLYDVGDAGAERIARSGTKRQRTSSIGQGDATSTTGAGSTTVLKKMSRARSDSAPLGYGLTSGLNNSWQGTMRPRSGSGMAPQRGNGMGVPNIGNSTRGNGGGPPFLSIPSLPNPPSR